MLPSFLATVVAQLLSSAAYSVPEPVPSPDPAGTQRVPVLPLTRTRLRSQSGRPIETSSPARTPASNRVMSIARSRTPSRLFWSQTMISRLTSASV